MAFEDIKDKGFDSRTTEEQQIIATMGGKASGEARREKASLKKAVQWILNADLKELKTKDFDKESLAKFYKDRGFDISKLNPSQLSAIGLWLGSVYGNATNFRTLGDYNDEQVEDSSNTTPTLKIEIADNSSLEKTMYEENQSKQDDDR